MAAFEDILPHRTLVIEQGKEAFEVFHRLEPVTVSQSRLLPIQVQNGGAIRQPFDYAAVKALAKPEPVARPQVRIPAPDLRSYDALLNAAGVP